MREVDILPRPEVVGKAAVQTGTLEDLKETQDTVAKEEAVVVRGLWAPMGGTRATWGGKGATVSNPTSLELLCTTVVEGLVWATQVWVAMEVGAEVAVWAFWVDPTLEGEGVAVVGGGLAVRAWVARAS